MVMLEFFDPCGNIATVRPHAARLATLEGKRIGLLSNDQWQASRMLPVIKDMLEQDIPGIDVLALDTFPRGNNLIGTEATATLAKQHGVDAVIILNAA